MQLAHIIRSVVGNMPLHYLWGAPAERERAMNELKAGPTLVANDDGLWIRVTEEGIGVYGHPYPAELGDALEKVTWSELQTILRDGGRGGRRGTYESAFQAYQLNQNVWTQTELTRFRDGILSAGCTSYCMRDAGPEL